MNLKNSLNIEARNKKYGLIHKHLKLFHQANKKFLDLSNEQRITKNI